MGIRDEIRALKRQAEISSIVIPQKDGTVAKFPKSALADAFLVNLQRMTDEDIDPHPLSVAIENSTDPDRYSGTFFDSEMRVVGEDDEPLDSAVEDLAE